MSQFGRNNKVYVSYDEDKVNMADVYEDLVDMSETFYEKPETYPGKDRLTIIHTGMLGPNLKLIKRKIKRAVIKTKAKILNQDDPAAILQRIEKEIAELEEKLQNDTKKYRSPKG